MSEHESTVGAAEEAQSGLDQDWRVRLALAQGSDYLYNAPIPGILAPLVNTDGVVFPYTPAINISYAASYDGLQPTHTNYKVQQYKSSSIADISVVADFTCQDTKEANYVLACIHFFKSMTKMLSLIHI